MTKQNQNLLKYCPNPYLNLNNLKTTFQKFTFKSKNLNTLAENLNKLIFNEIRLSIIGFLSMCNKIYFRITTPKIIPSFLYWHLINDFKLHKVKIIGVHKKFLGLRNLSNHNIYFGRLKDFGIFVKREKHANISIVSNGKNLGQVELLKENYFEHKWNLILC